MRTLGGMLKPGGFLFVGPAEAFLASSTGFTPVNRAMSFAFRKGPKKPAPSESSFEPAKKQVMRRLKIPNVPGSRPAAAPKSTGAAAPSNADGLDLESGRRLADAGRLKEAGKWCEAKLKELGPTAEIFHLMGLVQDASGDRATAAAYYRKAIYLDPDHLEGLLHLALIMETQGDRTAAERLRERARRVERRSKEKAL